MQTNYWEFDKERDGTIGKHKTCECVHMVSKFRMGKMIIFEAHTYTITTTINKDILMSLVLTAEKKTTIILFFPYIFFNIEDQKSVPIRCQSTYYKNKKQTDTTRYKYYIIDTKSNSYRQQIIINCNHFHKGSLGHNKVVEVDVTLRQWMQRYLYIWIRIYI